MRSNLNCMSNPQITLPKTKMNLTKDMKIIEKTNRNHKRKLK